jgi:hypothetical protein
MSAAPGYFQSLGFCHGKKQAANLSSLDVAYLKRIINAPLNVMILHVAVVENDVKPSTYSVTWLIDICLNSRQHIWDGKARAAHAIFLRGR